MAENGGDSIGKRGPRRRQRRDEDDQQAKLNHSRRADHPENHAVLTLKFQVRRGEREDQRQARGA